MKRLYIGLFALLLLIVPCFVPISATAYAAGASVTVSTVPQSPQVGDIVTINLTFSAGDAIGSFEADLTYDDSYLEYVSGGGNAVELSGGTGGFVDNGSATTRALSYSLRFRAIKAGEANVAITDATLTDYHSGEVLGNLKKSMTISIKETSTATPPTPTPTPSTQGPIPVTVDGKTAYILRDLQDVLIPDGFSAATVSYHDVEVPAAVHPSQLTLLPVLNAGGDVGFYIYEAAADVLYPYVTLAAGGGEYAIFPLGGISLAGYAPATVAIGNRVVDALASEANAHFYLVYAMNGQGDSGYYFYDAMEGTMQRTWVTTANPPVDQDKQDTAMAQPADTGSVWLVFLVLAGVCILLLVLNMLKLRKKQ